MRFTYDALAGRVVFGRGARGRLPEEIERLGTDRILVVSGPSHGALAGEVEALLGDRVVGRFGDLAQHVPETKATAAQAHARDVAADVVLTVGGGTAIGFGKAIALATSIPVVALPTTYSGSEMTPVWGMSDGSRKWTGHEPGVQPAVVVYDPEVTLSLPPTVSGPSGMNALAHAAEALYAPGANPVTSLLALEAVRVITRALPAVCATPDDLDERTEMLYGAYLAACALAVAGTALHHKTSHTLGGMFGLDHGGMNAALLPHTLRYNEPAIPEAWARLRDAMDGRDPADACYDLAGSIGAPQSLASLGMPPDGVGTALSAVVDATATNVREPDPDLIEAMLHDAYEGRRPPTHTPPGGRD